MAPPSPQRSGRKSAQDYTQTLHATAIYAYIGVVLGVNGAAVLWQSP